jgi:hypothetical protein
MRTHNHECRHTHAKPGRMPGGLTRCRIWGSRRRMLRRLADWAGGGVAARKGTVLVPGPLDVAGIWYSAMKRCNASGTMFLAALGRCNGKTFIKTCSMSTTFDPRPSKYEAQASMIIMDRESSASTGFRMLMSRRETHIMHHTTEM